VSELIQTLRRELNDTQRIEYSDEELLSYINRAKDFIVDELLGIRSPLLLKQAVLTPTNGSAPLPEHFAVEHAVIANGVPLQSSPIPYNLGRDSYSVFDGSLYVNADSVLLYYYARIPDLSFDSSIDEPLALFIPLLIVLAVMFAKNRTMIPVSLEPTFLQDLRRKIRDYSLRNTSIAMSAPVKFRAIRWK